MKTLKISHYLNKNLKPFNDGVNDCYPVYIRVLWGREVIRIKSIFFNRSDKTNDYLSEKEFESRNSLNLFETEKKIITHIFENGDQYFSSEETNLSDLIAYFTRPIIEIFSSAVYLYFSTETPKGFDEPFDFFSKKLVENLQNENAKFLEKSIKIDVANFGLIKDFSFIKDSPELKVIFETLKELNIFIAKFYNDEKPLNVYEWLLNGGVTMFSQFVKPAIRNSKIFEKLINEVSFYLSTTLKAT